MKRIKDVKKFWIRILCIVLAVLLGAGSIVSLLWSIF